MLEIRTSRTGLPVPYWDGHPLHSTYDPLKEARRYISRSMDDVPAPRVVVIVGAAQGYLAAAARECHPAARVISVYLHKSLFRAAGPDPQWAWHPENRESLGSYLMGRIDESDLESLSIIEWSPAIRVLADEAANARGQLRTLVARLKANYATTAAMGRLWIRNTVANFVSLPQATVTICVDPDRPLIIAGSGPSLEDSIEALARVRSRCDLWALPSAVAPLLARDMVPDLIVQTDPGTYASWHLHPAQGRHIPVAMPLSGARGVWRASEKIHLIRQPYVFEQVFLQTIGCPSSPAIAPQGTVAATAYRLAMIHGYRTIIFSGLDFCFRDILSHARPSLFDSYHVSSESRMTPNHTWLFAQAVERAPSRHGLFRTSPALDAYAAWFAEASSPAQIYRLNPTGRAVTTMTPLEGHTLDGQIERLIKASGPTAAMTTHNEPVGLQANLSEAAIDMLDVWIDKVRFLSGIDPLHWETDVRELCHFADLPRLSRLKSSPNSGRRDELTGSVAAFLGSTRSRLAENTDLETEWSRANR